MGLLYLTFTNRFKNANKTPAITHFRLTEPLTPFYGTQFEKIPLHGTQLAGTARVEFLNP